MQLPRATRLVCKIGGERVFLWRAVDDEGEVLDIVVQKRRDTRAALKLLKQLLRSQPVEPESIVTDGLASYGSALRVLGREQIHRPGRLSRRAGAKRSAAASPKAGIVGYSCAPRSWKPARPTAGS